MFLFDTSMSELGWLLFVIAIVIGIITGLIFAYYLPIYKKRRAEHNAKKIIQQAETKADRIVKNAQLDGKQTVYELKQEAEKDIKERKQEVIQQENKLLQREQSINARDNALTKKESNLEEKENYLDKQIEENKKRKEVLQERLDGIIEELQKVSQMSIKEAKDEIFKRVEEKCSREIALYIKNKEEEAESTCEEKAKNILANAMFKQAQEITTEKTISVIALPNDEMKGRIIGRDGRNIKSLEQLLGVDIIIDDTPEALTVSCFNPIRREVASRALNVLIKDGRIQPGRIEEVVA